MRWSRAVAMKILVSMILVDKKSRWIHFPLKREQVVASSAVQIQRSRILLFFLIIFTACKPEKIELIKFPKEFYEECQIDSSNHLFFIVTGDDLYLEKNKTYIDSLVLTIVKTKKYMTVTLYKEGSVFDREDFGQGWEPFGDEWESYLGDYRYSYYVVNNNKKIEKGIYDKRKLIELNGQKIE